MNQSTSILEPVVNKDSELFAGVVLETYETGVQFDNKTLMIKNTMTWSVFDSFEESRWRLSESRDVFVSYQTESGEHEEEDAVNEKKPWRGFSAEAERPLQFPIFNISEVRQ